MVLIILSFLAAIVVSPMPASAISLGMGYGHSCAELDGQGYCWGWNKYGQLGNGSFFDALGPKKIIGLSGGVEQIASWDMHTCAIVDSGLQCWGKNTFGGLGTGDRMDRTSPTEVRGLSSGVTYVATGNNYTCAVVSGGLQCWGWNRSCQLGKAGCVGGENNNDDMELLPRWVDGLGPGSGVTKVAASQSHTCAVVNGGAKCWGVSFFGKTGDGEGGQRYADVPRDVVTLGPNSGVTDIVTGGWHSCALVNGGVKCWGYAKTLGQNKSSDSSVTTPDYAVGLKTGVTKIAGNENTTCAIRSDNELWCFGSGSMGQLGIGKVDNAYKPIKAKLPANIKIKDVSVGRAHVCAATEDKVYCWGWNSFCQVGDGNCVQVEPSPQEVLF